MVELVEEAGVLHGYLENQLFQPNLERGKQIVWARGAAASGRPYLARAAEEHGGPHMPWFWQGDLQGGGVLNDMMCHSLEVGRYLLTEPGAPRNSIRPVKVSAQIASLKWSRPEYVKLLRGNDDRQGRLREAARPRISRAPRVNYVDDAGTPLIVEATTSWSYVGAGLRLSMELLGPEYSMSVSTLEGGTKVFFSRRLQEQQAGEDLIEKQNAEQGLMPIVGNEAARVRLRKREPRLHALVSRRRAAGTELPRRPRRHRAVDGVLHERRGGAGDRMETGQPADTTSHCRHGAATDLTPIRRRD